MQLTIQNVLIVVLPLLGLILPGVLKQDKYSPQVNSLLAGIVVVLASAGTAYSKDQFNANFFVDMAVVLAGISALLSGPMKGLDAYLQSNVFSTPGSQLAAVLPVSAPVVASASIPANALIHIASVNTVHVNAPVGTSDVAPTTQESAVPGEVVSDAPLAPAGVILQKDVNDVTQKIKIPSKEEIAAAKSSVTTPLAQG